MFRWSRPQPTALSAQSLLYDIHNHILPDVDDGARNVDEAIQSIEVLKDLGYGGAVLTPHIYREMFNNDEASLIERFGDFVDQVSDQIDGFDLKLGAEYLLDDQFLDKLYDASDQLLTFGNDPRKLLIEFSGLVEPLNTTELLDECRRQGIQPVIAHIERYPFVIDDRNDSCVQEWRQHGALLQMNVGSLTGQYGSVIQRAARHLWRNTLVDLLGTDLHRPYGTRRFLHKSWEYIRKTPNGFDAVHHRKLFEATPS